MESKGKGKKGEGRIGDKMESGRREMGGEGRWEEKGMEQFKVKERLGCDTVTKEVLATN